MSTFGPLGVGGSVPGKFPGAPDESPVALDTATTGTDSGQPDSKPTSAVSTFGAPEHNKA